MKQPSTINETINCINKIEVILNYSAAMLPCMTASEQNFALLKYLKEVCRHLVPDIDLKLKVGTNAKFLLTSCK